jgi:hypothetical protein
MTLLEGDAMTRASKTESALKGGFRGAAEGAVLGLIVVPLRLTWKWIAASEPVEFSDHLGEIILYSAAYIASLAFIFGVGRAISGGWFGSVAGACLLGLVGVWLGGHIQIPGTVNPQSIFAGLGIGGAMGAVLGAIAERLVWQRGSSSRTELSS